MHSRVTFLVLFLTVATSACPSLAYPVAHSLPLDKLEAEADVVVKVQVTATKPVDDPWFEKVVGYRPVETEARVISVVRGEELPESIRFRHYAPAAEGEQPAFFMPQWYQFEIGRSYILAADATDESGVYRQIWKNHRSQEDQGQLLTLNASPHVGDSLKRAYWLELTKLLTSEKGEDVRYAIQHLDRLSGGAYDQLGDFDRQNVLDVLQPLSNHKDEELAREVLRVLGCGNPYFSSETSAFWLVTIGDGHLPGIGSSTDKSANLGGKSYWRELAEIVDSDRPIETRELALRALGRADEPEVLKLVLRWLEDRVPRIQAAAVVLLSDFPKEADRNVLTTLAKHSDSRLRKSVAQAIGYGRMEDLLPLLGTLVDDQDSSVSQAAAMSLLSFKAEKSGDVLRAKLQHPQFRPLFINALAQEHPEEFLEELADNIRKHHEPENWWGGQVPWGVSFDLLLRYAQRQSAKELQSSRLQPVLEALEHPASGKEGAPSYYSSSLPRDVYALYKARGLDQRASRFRAQCKKTITYDIDYYFNMADENPQQYLP